MKYSPGGRVTTPRKVFWIVLGLILGRLPFGGDHFLTTFLAYVLGHPKTIILPLLGFGLSRGHGLYNPIALLSSGDEVSIHMEADGPRSGPKGGR